MNPISSIVRTQLSGYAIIIDLILIVYLNSHDARSSYSHQLFTRVLIVIAFATAAEAMSFLTGVRGNTGQIPLHYLSNSIYLSTVALPGSLGITYLDFKIFGNEQQSKRRFLIYLIPTYVCVGLVLVNIIRPGLLFYITDSNQYHRGTGAYVILFFTATFLALVLAYFYRFRHMIAGRLTQAILIFSLLPVLGAIVQAMALGTTFTMPSYTLAAFITFLLLERDEMTKDPLTRLYTRTNLENRIRFKLKGNEPFSFVLIDLNDFKLINDRFGHLEGDSVLNIVSEILMECTNIEDTVCRFGGDEFCLLVEFKDDIREKLIGRIENELNRYGEQKSKYRISASYGYVFVEDPSGTTYEQLIEEADKRMYQDKMERKAKKKIAT